MSNEQKMVSVPREWRDMTTAPRDGTLVRLLVRFTEHSTEDEPEAPTIGANYFDNTEVDEWQFAGWSWEQDCFTQGQGEPIGWLPLLDEPAAQHQVEPVAYVCDAATAQHDRPKGYGDILSEWLPVGTELFTHSDSGEVERLRESLGCALKSAENVNNEVIALRCQLAEREALLRDLLQCNVGFDMRQRLEKALAASAVPSEREAWALQEERRLGIERLPAEPSAPVERDERAEFEAVYAREFSAARGYHYTAEDIALMRDGVGGYGDRAYLNGQWIGWQARADLERKPSALVAQLQADLTQRDERIDLLDGLLRRAWDHVNISDVDLIVEIKAAIPGIASERGFTPTITIPPGAERYDGSDNGVD